MKQHRRRNRPFYRTSIAMLSTVVLAISQVIGWQALALSHAIAKSDSLAKFERSGILLGCVAAIFLLIWGMVGLTKKRYVRRPEGQSRLPVSG
jgi:hypothetical protein